jgi:hypothetical protein
MAGRDACGGWEVEAERLSASSAFHPVRRFGHQFRIGTTRIYARGREAGSEVGLIEATNRMWPMCQRLVSAWQKAPNGRIGLMSGRRLHRVGWFVEIQLGSVGTGG